MTKNPDRQGAMQDSGEPPPDSVPSLSYVMRPCFSTYVVFALVPSVGFLLSMYTLLFTDTYAGTKFSGDWGFELFLFVSTLVIVAGISRFRLIIQNQTLSYRSLFKGTRSLDFPEIAQARIEVRLLKGGQQRGQPPFALIVEPYPHIHKPPIIINMKVFGRKDIQHLFSFFGDKLVDKEHRIVGGLPRMIRFGKSGK